MMCSRKLNILTPCRAGIEIFILNLKEDILVMTCSALKFLCFLMLRLVSGRKKEIIYKCSLTSVIYYLASFEKTVFCLFVFPKLTCKWSFLFNYPLLPFLLLLPQKHLYAVLFVLIWPTSVLVIAVNIDYSFSYDCCQYIALIS